MKLRATIYVDTEAKDFREAAEIQKELDELCQTLSQKHTRVEFDIRERREQKKRGQGARAKPARSSGGGVARNNNKQAAE